MANKIQIKHSLEVLKVFSNTNKWYSLKDAQDALGLSYEPTHRHINELVKTNHLLRKLEGKKTVYKINTENPTTLKVLELSGIKHAEQIEPFKKVKISSGELEKRKKFGERHIKTPLLIVLIVFIAFYAIGFAGDGIFSFGGFFASERDVLNFQQNVNLELTETDTYNFVPEAREGNYYLGSISVSGVLEGTGGAKIYLLTDSGEKILIADTEELPHLKKITAFAIKDIPGEGEKPSKAKGGDFVILPIETPEDVQEPIDPEIPEETEEPIDIIEPEEEQDLPEEIEPPAEQEEIIDETEETPGIEEESEPISTEMPEDVEETEEIIDDESEQAVEEEQIEESNETEGSVEDIDDTEEIIEEYDYIVIDSVCKESCRLFEKNLTAERYDMLVEIDGAVTVNINTIHYSLVFEELIPENATVELVEYEKIQEDENFTAEIHSAELVENNLIIVFSHDSPMPQPFYINGNISYGSSKNNAPPGENITLTVFNWAYDYFELKIGAESEIFAFGDQEVGFNPVILDAEGNIVDATIILTDSSNKQTRIDIERGQAPPGAGMPGQGIPGIPDKIKKDNYKANITLHIHPIKEIKINNLAINSDTVEFLKVDNTPENIVEGAVEVYAIDPTAINFTTADVTVTAKGNLLYKCAEWNFEARSCEGAWVFQQEITPGGDYTITMGSGEVAYAEIIEITNAMHLDSERNVIEDVYNLVKERDYTYALIPNGDYLRVVFEQNLTSEKDITIYAKSSNAGRIEVYEKDSDVKLADFGEISADEKYQILLTNLQGEQDTFDLKVTGGDVEFNYVVDPLMVESVSYCIAQDNTVDINNWSQPCDAPNGSYLRLSDGILETHETSKQGGTRTYAGVRVQSVNTSITNCLSVSQVFLCYEWWIGDTNSEGCSVVVHNNTNTSLGAIISSTCPGAIPNPGVICVNVTADRTWSCENFFGTTGTRAAAHLQVRRSPASANGAWNLSVDALYFNVTYIDDLHPNVSLISPANGNITPKNNVDFICNATDDIQLSNMTFYWNYSGTWQANGTVPLSGTANSTTFERTNLDNGEILWNCQACDNISQCSFAPANRTTIIQKSDPPNVSLVFPDCGCTDSNGELTFKYNVSGTEHEISNCSLIFNGSIDQTNVNIIQNEILFFKKGNLKNNTYTWQINCTDSLGAVGSSEIRNFTVMRAHDGYAEVKATLESAKEESYNATIRFIDPGNGGVDYVLTGPEVVVNLAAGEYNLEIIPENHVISNISIKGAAITSNVTSIIGLDICYPEILIQGTVQSFAVNPFIDFNNGTFSFIPEGNYLYKCADWNYTERECLGEWVKIMDVEPDQEVSVQFDPTDPAYVVGIDTTCINISTANYKVCVYNQTENNFWGYILDYYSLNHNSSSDLSGAYVADYVRLWKGDGPGAGYYLLKQALAAVSSTINENGSYRVSLTFNYGNAIYLDWYFYDEYYVGRLRTTSYTSANDGINHVMVMNDSNATGGYDRNGLSYVYGSKSVSPINTTTATTTTTYDTFDQNSVFWTAWYGTNQNDIHIGTIGYPMPVGGNDFRSRVDDIETTGNDFFNQDWDLTDSITNYDNMFTIGILYNGSSYNYTRDWYLVYTNPATILSYSASGSNISTIGFNNKSFVYQFNKNATDGNSKFNVTGNSSWFNSNEKIYFQMFNTSNNNNLYKWNNDSAWGWTLLLNNSSIQYNTNGSYYNAIFPINKTATTTETYIFGLDNIPPEITVISPQNTTYTNNSIWFNITATDNVAVDKCVFSLDGQTNTPMSNDGSTNWYYLQTVSDGPHNVTFYCNDTSGNIQNSTVYFYKIYLYLSNLSLNHPPNIAYFDNYNYTVFVNNSSSMEYVNLTYKTIKAGGGDCYQYYVNGSCAGNESTIVNMSYFADNIWYYSPIRPDHLYPEIMFMQSEITWYNTPTFIDIYSTQYHIFRFTNNYTINPNTSFWIEFDARARPTTTRPINVYLFDNTTTITTFQSNWLSAPNGELVAAINPGTEKHHNHTENSSHYLVTLTANENGFIGNKNLSVNGEFWIVLRIDTSATNNYWNLSYRNGSLCNTTNWWIGGGGWTTTQQTTGCPDTHVHVARYNLSGSSDCINSTSCGLDTNLLSNCTSNFTCFGQIPNLPPVANAITFPLINNSYKCPINITWNAFIDPNYDVVTYNISLLNADNTFNQTLNGSTTNTWYYWNCSAMPDGNYSLRVNGSDPGGLYSYIDMGGNFTIDNTNPTIYYNPTTTSPGTYSQNYIFVNITCSDVNRDTVIFNWNGTNESFANIDGDVFWTNKTGLVDGTYNFYAWCNDTATNYNQTDLNTVTLDSTPPYWSNLQTNPASPAFYVSGGNYQFNITWVDNGVGISDVILEFYGTNYSYLNSEIQKSGGEYYITLNDLAANETGYNYKWYSNDTLDNWNATGTLTYVINKADNPVTLLLNGGASNLTVTYGQASNASATGIGVNLYRNGSSVSNPEIAMLGAGMYVYFANATGDANYSENSTGVNYNLTVEQAVPTCSLSFDPVSPIDYGTAVNVSCSCSDSLSAELYKNGSNVTGEIGVNVTLGAGTYAYECNTSETANFTSASNTSNFVVNKAATQTLLYLNGSQSNTLYNVGDTANFTVVLNVSGKTVYLDTNISGWVLQTGTTPLTNITLLDVGGYFNITGYFAGDANYSESSATWFANVSDTQAPSIGIPSSEPSTINQTQTTNITVDITDNGVIHTTLLNVTYPNGTSITYPMVEGSGDEWYFEFNFTEQPGTYTYWIFTNDTAGNFNNTTTYTFAVDDVTAPSVESITVAGTEINQTDSIEISVNVTDYYNDSVDYVYANITYPNGTTVTYPLAEFGNTQIFNTTFTDTLQPGQYNVTFFGNDTAGNSNTSTTYFIVNDVTAPAVSDLTITPNTINQTNTTLISVNVTDYYWNSIDAVTANISWNSAYQIIPLAWNGSNYVANFSNTSFAGTYNVTIIANDTAGNINNSEWGTFIVNDITLPTIISTIPTNNSVLPAGTTSINMTVNTDEQAVCRYNTTNEAWENMTEFNTTNATSSIELISGLTNGATYNYYILCQDVYSNNMASSYLLAFSVATPIDTTGPGGTTPIIYPPVENETEIEPPIITPNITDTEDPIELILETIIIGASETETERMIVKNIGNTTIENVTAVVNAPEEIVVSEIHRGYRINLFGKWLAGWTVNGKSSDRLVEWDLDQNIFIGNLKPGEEKEIFLDMQAPLASIDNVDVLIEFLSGKTSISNKTIPIRLELPNVAIAADVLEDKTVDIYFVINNLDNVKELRNVFIEFNLNKGRSTKIIELFGPYTVPAGEVKVMAQNYQLHERLTESNSNITIRVYELFDRIGSSNYVLNFEN